MFVIREPGNWSLRDEIKEGDIYFDQEDPFPKRWDGEGTQIVYLTEVGGIPRDQEMAFMTMTAPDRKLLVALRSNFPVRWYNRCWDAMYAGLLKQALNVRVIEKPAEPEKVVEKPVPFPIRGWPLDLALQRAFWAGFWLWVLGVVVIAVSIVVFGYLGNWWPEPMMAVLSNAVGGLRYWAESLKLATVG